jgi:tetratricopeptide (TPR) repeat protein
MKMLLHASSRIDRPMLRFERAAALDPDSSDAVAGLLRLDARAGDTAKAVSRAEAHVRAAPSDPAAFVLAAHAYLAADNLTQAEASLKRGIALDASYRPAYALLSTVYTRQGKPAQAQQMYERLVQQRPNDVPALTMIGILLEAQQKPDEAKKAYERALALDSRSPLASNNLAYLHAEDGRNLDVALNLAQVAKAALPDDPTVSDTLGWVNYKRDLPAFSIEHLKESAQKEPSNPVYHYHLGLAYLKAGDKGRGRASLERALNLDANFAGAADARRALASIG